MKLIKVAAGILNQTPLDWEQNKNNIVSAINAAREQKTSILCLPELCITGYGCEDAFHSPGVHATALEVLDEIAQETSEIIVSVGLPVFHAGGVFNCACLLANRRILGFVGKQHLAGDGIHYEPRWFKRWLPDRVAQVDLGKHSYPLGDLVFRCGEVNIGFEICEDAWVGERPGADLAARGVDIILNPSASHFAFDKHQVRERFVLEGSRAFQVSYVYANLVGNEAGRAIYDGDTLIATNGKTVARGRRFSYHDFALTTAVVDIEATRLQRARTGSFEPDLSVDPEDLVNARFEYPRIEPQSATLIREAWELSLHKKQEEFTRAVSLALFDYMRKSRSHGFVVSLSGGADSTAVSCLIALMIGLVDEQLGMAGIHSKLSYIQNISDQKTPAELVQRLLTTVYQATRNSSDTTRNAARAVAQAIHARHFEFDVDQIVESYKTLISSHLGRPLDWSSDDITLQNIQARARAPSVWMLANIFNALLISTSNRSEAAVGYATMDGDTCGGISAIAGIDKAFLREWLVWLENSGPEGIGPIDAVRSVNVQQPTAELRPQSEGQTDEGDLMPYPILDQIERLAIRDKLMPLEVLRMLRSEHNQQGVRQLATWIDRFFKLWCRNQWKRERYAPSFHLDDENLDPKTWCRFPILSGGFARELKQMWAAVDELD
jgi:NAD+ synthase (glutamine-hydrolysing)